MINNDLIKYFREGINGGHSKESLKKELLNAGWSEVDVDDSLNSVSVINTPIIPGYPKLANNNSQEKERPTGVAIVAVLAWISAGFSALMALFSLLFFSALSSFIGNFGGESGGVLLFSILGFVLFGLLALFYFFFGRGLWRGQNGWRIFYMVILGISTIFLITNILVDTVSTIFNLGIAGFLFWYFGFKKNVVEFFKK